MSQFHCFLMPEVPEAPLYHFHKIQLDDPGISDHSIEFPETKLRIPLSLNEMFSYFPTTKPTAQMLEDCEEIYVLDQAGGTLMTVHMLIMKLKC